MNIPKPLKPSKFRPDMLETVVKIGTQGGSTTAQAVACGLTPRQFIAMISEGSEHYVPALAEAHEIAKAIAQVYFENIGLQASLGLIKQHSSPSYTFLMKNFFASSFKDETVTRHEGGISVSPKMDAITASEAYKRLLASTDSSEDDVLKDLE